MNGIREDKKLFLASSGFLILNFEVERGFRGLRIFENLFTNF